MSAAAMFFDTSFAAPEAATAFGRGPNEPMDEAKFEVFYRRMAGGIWSYIYRMTGNPTLTDDLMQKTFFRFIRSRPTIANDDHLRRYVYKTATNLVLDHFREAKRERLYGPIDASMLAAGAESRADRGELRHDMMRVFSELKPQERALLWLAHVEGESHEAIGEALGVKAKSVKVMLFRARKHLGDLLSKKGLAPGTAPGVAR
jgi:RNA polymerase sigma-70 factor, ECF subfamily